MTMPAYLIVAGSINDPHKWAAYRVAVLPLIQRFGGIHRTGGGVIGRRKKHNRDF
jgi:uncharacterized protein (DUF1330 family)